MVGIFIVFNNIEYVGFIDDVRNVSEAQHKIAVEVNDNGYFNLRNPRDGDIIFPKHALFLADIRMVNIDG